jgi:hypothetical protein
MLNRIIDATILACLFGATSYLVGYGYFGAIKVAFTGIPS